MNAPQRRDLRVLLRPVDPGDASAATSPMPRLWARIRGSQTIPGLRTIKVAFATALAYVVADLAPGGQPPIVAALTALLVVQLTPYQTVKTGWQRIGSVVSGVLIAVLLSSVVGLTWWSLGITVLAALIVGHVLRLGGNAVEVPISAMLVLAVAGNTDVGLARVYETLIGAGVGVLVSMLMPQAYVQPAGDAIGNLATDVGHLLRSMADDVEEEWTADRAMKGLKRAREFEGAVATARAALSRAEDSVRLHPRGLAAAHVPQTLRSGLTALEYSVINVRVVNRALVDRVQGHDAPGPDVRRPLAELLRVAADAVVAFGDVVSPDVTGPARDADELRRALAVARTARDAASAALLVDAGREPAIWRMHGALLGPIDRLLVDLDPDAELAVPAVTRPRPAAQSSVSLRRLSRSVLRRRTVTTGAQRRIGATTRGQRRVTTTGAQRKLNARRFGR
jgi:hypothetical protein